MDIGLILWQKIILMENILLLIIVRDSKILMDLFNGPL